MTQKQREILRKCEMRIFFCKLWKLCENSKIFSQNAKILWKPWVLKLQQLIPKNCGILCSDSSIFEVLLCHINYFSSFTKCLNFAHVFKNSVFFTKFSHLFTKFLHFFSLNFRIIFCELFAFFRETDWSKIWRNRSKQNFSFSLETILTHHTNSATHNRKFPRTHMHRIIILSDNLNS